MPAIEKLDPSIRERLKLQLVDERLSGKKNIDTLLENGLEQLLVSGALHVGQISTLTPESGPEIDPFDLVFLGIGEDGHVASLFPGSYPELDDERTPVAAVIIDAPKEPPIRVTITYRGFRILAADAEVVLLGFGEAKRSALERLLSGEDADRLPCAFFPANFRCTCLMTDLSGQLFRSTSFQAERAFHHE